MGIFGALGTVFKPQGVMLQTLISEAVTAAVAESSVAFHSFFHPVLKSAWAGLFAGGLHTLTGADHLAALTPLSVGPSRAKKCAPRCALGIRSQHRSNNLRSSVHAFAKQNLVEHGNHRPVGPSHRRFNAHLHRVLRILEQVGGGHGHSHPLL